MLAILVGFALAVATSGCMDDDGGRRHISKSDLRQLVLLPYDLPRAFSQFDFGELAVTDIHPGPRADQARFGRLGGWKARYRRAGTAHTSGPLVVESRVDVFGDEGGAAHDLEAYEAEFEQTADRFTGPARSLGSPGLADGSTAMTLTQRGGRVPVRLFTVAWRRGEVTASISVNGFEGKIAFEHAVALARKQDRRLAQALEG
jgi:hypothetical protein